MQLNRATRDLLDVQAEFQEPWFLWNLANAWHRAKSAKTLDSAFWEGQRKALEGFDKKHGSSVATAMASIKMATAVGAGPVPVPAKTSAPCPAPALAKSSAPRPAPAMSSAPAPFAAPAISSVLAPVPALAMSSVPVPVPALSSVLGPALAPAPPRCPVPASPLPSHPDQMMQDVVRVQPRKKVMTKAEGKTLKY
jgi:hypothetical protein